MRAAPVLRAVSGGVTRRKVQTVVIFTVLLVSTASATLGLGLLLDSNAPFQHAFAAQRGAEVTASIDATRAASGQLASTQRLPQVTAAAGPFAEATITARISEYGGITLPPNAVAGRASPGGPVDDLTLDAGRWAQRPGEIVLSRDFNSPGSTAQLIGTKITVTSALTHPVLTVVGVAKSITDTADGWVLPAEIAALRTPHTPVAAQMLYRFHHADTQPQISADVTALTRALPAGTITGTGSWLTVKSQESGTIAIIVPFVVAFGVIGLVMSVLIVGNVVNGAVVSGYRRIGVLKSIGFTPAQVVAAYVAQAGIPALAGTLAGVVVGNVLSVPLLSQTATIYGVGKLLVPPSVDIVVPLAMAANGQSHAAAEQVQISPAMHYGPAPRGKGGKPGPAGAHSPSADRYRTLAAALQAQPGTVRWVAEAMPLVGVAGLTDAVSTEAFRGNAAWTGYDLISGRWYRAPGEVVVNTGFLTQTGKSVGDTVTLTFGGKQITARIVGEVFDPQGRGQPAMITSWQTLGGASAGLTVQQYDVGLRPGTDPNAYADALNHALFPNFFVQTTANDPFYLTLSALIGTLTLLIALAAGLGMLNTVILGTRDRVHDLGVFKSVGMTPRQTIAMVICWIAGAGLIAGVIAVPAAMILHSSVLRTMARAGGTAIPASYVNVFSPAELLLLALAGLVIGVAGALLPASWAARARTATALRAE